MQQLAQIFLVAITPLTLVLRVNVCTFSTGGSALFKAKTSKPRVWHSFDASPTPWDRPLTSPTPPWRRCGAGPTSRSQYESLIANV